MTAATELLHSLESLLVEEFRLCQALDRLTLAERAALSPQQAAELLAISKRKQALLDHMIRLGNARQHLLVELACQIGEPRLAEKPQQLLRRLGEGQSSTTAQLDQLHQGIQALTARVREQNRLNQALVRRALKRANALQSYLIGLCQRTPTGEEGTLPIRGNTLPAVLAAAVQARQALSSQDGEALRAAASNLQQALENLNEFLKSNAAEHTEAASPFPSPAPALEGRDDWVEFIADLYRQETAYQAVLHISQRMLASM